MLIVPYLLFNAYYCEYTMPEALESFKESLTFESCKESYERINKLLNRGIGAPRLSTSKLDWTRSIIK